MEERKGKLERILGTELETGSRLWFRFGGCHAYIFVDKTMLLVIE